MTTTITSVAKSSLTLGCCLIWDTERPYENVDRRSPIFIFKNCELCLKLKLDTSGYSTYDLYIVAATKSDNFPTLEVKTYYRSINVPEDLFVQRENISHSSNRISRVRLSSVKENLPEFKLNGNFTIVCVFDDPKDFTQPPWFGRQQAVHFPLNSSECFENLSKDFEALLDNKILPDVQLIVEETSIPCHRAVLATRSKVFAAMFQHDMTESTSGVLDIKDIDRSTIEVFLKYLYSGKLPDDLSEDMLWKLYESGDKYDVYALKRVSSSQMMKHVNKENCLTYLSLADAYSDEKFKDAIACFIVKDARIVKSQEWINFSSENLKLANEVYQKYFAIRDD